MKKEAAQAAAALIGLKWTHGLGYDTAELYLGDRLIGYVRSPEASGYPYPNYLALLYTNENCSEKRVIAHGSQEFVRAELEAAAVEELSHQEEGGGGGGGAK